MVTSANIQRTYIDELSSNMPKLEKKASDAIKSFADLVEELNKVNNLSTGTPVKDQISRLTGELNNSSVFFAKMLGEELGKIHSIVTPASSGETEIKV